LGRRESKDRRSSKELGVTINRNAGVTLYPFTDFFRGFEKVEAVRSTFGERTEEVLKNLRVEFFGLRFIYPIYDDLRQIPDCEVFVCNPRTIREKAKAKIKHDRVDARILGDSLRANYFPKSHMPDEETREKRFLTKERVMPKWVNFRPSARRITRPLLPSGFPFIASTGRPSLRNHAGQCDVPRREHAPVPCLVASDAEELSFPARLRRSDDAGATIRAFSGRAT